MSQLSENLKKARGSIVFLIGITLAFGTVFGLEQWKPGKVKMMTAANVSEIDSDTSIQLRKQRNLSSLELDMAKTAWKYFDNNTQDNGLVNSVHNYTAATLWDTASYLLALISAYELKLIPKNDFDQRSRLVLETLAGLPLFEDKLPNKSYSTLSASMTTYTNQQTERGVGWSAIDIGRIMVPFNVYVWRYPEFTPLVEKVLLQWQLDALVKDAELIGADVDEQGNTLYLQEGRLGYEEYAAKSLLLNGIDLSEALDYSRHFEYVDIDGVRVGTDLRTPDQFDALNFVVSEPYVLDGLEFGWDRYSRSLSYRVYQAQEARYKKTGIMTAVSEDNIDQAPYFVYNTVFADGKAWNAVTEKGEDASEFRSLSSKASIGLYALYDTDYTQKLFNRISDNYSSDNGWYAGIYEASGKSNKALTANTNAIVLEALRYIQLGPMIQIGRFASTQKTSPEG